MKRIVVFKSGANKSGKLLHISENLSETFAAISKVLKLKIDKLFTLNGEEINDSNNIKDGDIIYATCIENSKSFNYNINNVSEKWITLNVGGKLFTTTHSTLTQKEPNSMLARMFSSNWGDDEAYAKDNSGAYLIDRSSKHFEPLLNYLRHGVLIIDPDISAEGVLEEARFFRFESLIPQLEVVSVSSKYSHKVRPLTRQEVISVLIQSSHCEELRFQGVNLTGADLSHLDMRNINLKYACLHGCKLQGTTLSNCCLERADLSEAILDGAQLGGSCLLCANLENASLISCNFDEPPLLAVNMEGANLKGANLEGSNMCRVDLRVAVLKNANLKNCNLREAILAGADLENADLTYCDLYAANLRGANLKCAVFEFMQTPLHMSQTIH